jgi:hypothetical protein
MYKPNQTVSVPPQPKEQLWFRTNNDDISSGLTVRYTFRKGYLRLRLITRFLINSIYILTTFRRNWYSTFRDSRDSVTRHNPFNSPHHRRREGRCTCPPAEQPADEGEGCDASCQRCDSVSSSWTSQRSPKKQTIMQQTMYSAAVFVLIIILRSMYVLYKYGANKVQNLANGWKEILSACRPKMRQFFQIKNQ